MSSVDSLSPALWETVKCDFKGLFPEDVYQMWFEPMSCVETNGDSIVLSAPNDFALIWIQDNYLDLITQRLRLNSGRMVSVTLRKSSSTPPQRPVAAPAPEASGAIRHPRRPLRISEERLTAAGQLNPRNTFETFVVGPNSEMAHAAALAVANAPGHAYNPLFIYGSTGLGKTHLMHAIGHHVLKNRQEARVAYLSCEKFTNEFIHALQEKSLPAFRRRYRGMDLLLIDDIQFLAGKDSTQEEFFHTFNDLFESGRQIVLSSDRPAGEIARLENRLLSRLQWGMVADIQSPDFETRMAILRNKSALLKCEMTQDVMTFIAQHISKNVRRLEGALIKVASYCNLTGRRIDLAGVEELLKDVLMEQAQSQLNIETIQKRVADHYQIRHSDMVSRRRPANIVLPRQVAMYLARRLTRQSLIEIGEAFGGRDHGTVIHACKTIDNLMEQDPSIRSAVDYLKSQLSR